MSQLFLILLHAKAKETEIQASDWTEAWSEKRSQKNQTESRQKSHQDRDETFRLEAWQPTETGESILILIHSATL